MYKITHVENKWRNTNRTIKVVSPHNTSEKEIIDTVKAKEPYLRKDETFAVITSRQITQEEYKIIGGHHLVIKIAPKVGRSKKYTEKLHI